MKINPEFKARVEWLGDHVAPALIVDDFYLDPDAVRAQALERAYEQSGAFYPGRHAPLSADDDPEFAVARLYVAKLISRSSNMLVEPQNLSSDFSMVTTPTRMLLGKQGQPHIDGTPVLAVVYLNPEELGGTCFFHNKVMDTAVVVTPEQHETLNKLNENDPRFNDKHGYITDSKGVWERIGHIDGVYNRFACYPGNIFHSIDIKKAPSGESLEEQRLTQRWIVQAFSGLIESSTPE